MSKKRIYKTQSLIQVLFVLALFILLNILSSVFHTRFDLTKEGRFTLTDATTKLLSQTEDVITVRVFLEGEFPAGIKRLSNATRDILDEFRAYTGNQLQYEFIDPLDTPNAEERKAITQQLTDKGLLPRRLFENEEGYSANKVFFPGALVLYQGKEYPVMLLEEQGGKGAQTVINNSISLLEFKLANAIQKLQRSGKPRIAFLRGHKEWEGENIADISNALAPYYILSELDLVEFPLVPREIDVLIIAKPILPFQEAEKFKIDQFVMQGGKVMWLFDPLVADIDSLQTRTSFIAPPYNLNIEDMLFKYGVRVNENLVQDLRCNPIPLVVGVDQSGNAQQQRLFPWLYHPILTGLNQEHPITKNLGAVATEFVSTIDTIKQAGIKKDILLATSQFTKVQFSPVKVDIEAARERPNEKQFKKSFQPVAVSLEGIFPSVFKNRLAFSTLEMLDTIKNFKLREESVPNKMIVIADGDLIRNEFDKRNNRPLPLGYYKFTKETFANKDFLLNCIEWLLDNSGIIVARSKDVQLRLLDDKRIKEEKNYWQIFNISIPLIMVLIGGLLYGFWRHRKYAS